MLAACSDDKTGGAAVDSSAVDSIAVVSASPVSATAGTSTIFSIDVDYRLASRANGEINIGFNSSLTCGVNCFILDVNAQDTSIVAGSGSKTYSSTVIPVDWGSSGGFQVYANLSEYPHGSSWTPMANDTHPIAVTQSQSAPMGSLTKGIGETDAPRAVCASHEDLNPLRCGIP